MSCSQQPVTSIWCATLQQTPHNYVYASLIIQIPRFDRTVQTQKMSMEWPVSSDNLFPDLATPLTYDGGCHIRGGRLFRSGPILELDHLRTSLGYSLKS